MPLTGEGIALISGLTFALIAAGPDGSATAALELVADVPLPGPATRFDYQCIDTTANRLYVSHMNAGQLVVVDLGSRTVEATIDGLPRITGVWAVPALGKVFASVPGDHQVAIVDAHSLHVEARVGPIGFPDGIAYAPPVKKVYVSDESGGGELVIDAVGNRVVGTIPLGGEAGNTTFDPASGRVLVAVQTRNELAAIDPRSDRVIGRFRLSGSSHPHGMAIDADSRRLFVASEEGAIVQTVDLRTMKVIDEQPVGDDPDVLAFDASDHRLYVAAESGVVSVFSEQDGKLRAEGQVTMPHAHTVAVDSRTHLVYFPLQDIGGHPRLRIMRGRR
jgi:DNA-binding beta-propeller fold protein YncE